MGVIFMAVGAFGDLPPAGAGRDRIAARILPAPVSKCRNREGDRRPQEEVS
jgi:hypothetical protein